MSTQAHLHACRSMLPPGRATVFTVTLNPAIDRTITVPGFAAGVVNRVLASSDKAGGKGVNVAVALALGGTAVTATGLLGSGNRTPFTEAFGRLGITDAFVALEGKTRIGLKIVNPDNEQTTDINFPGLRPGGQALATVREQLLAAVKRHSQGAVKPQGTVNSQGAVKQQSAVKQQGPQAAGAQQAGATDGAASWVALCGSLPPGVDATLYADWITALKASGAHVLLDTSGPAFRHALAAAPAVIKPNRSELEELLGRPLAGPVAVAAAARELIRAYGLRLVAVSMGAEGACFVSAAAAVRVLPVRLPVHSTVGAGDAMVAGILYAQNAVCSADGVRAEPVASDPAGSTASGKDAAAQAAGSTASGEGAVAQAAGSAASDSVHSIASDSACSAASERHVACDPAATLAQIACHGTAFSLATLQQPAAALPEVFCERVARWLPQIRLESIEVQ